MLYSTKRYKNFMRNLPKYNVSTLKKNRQKKMILPNAEFGHCSSGEKVSGYITDSSSFL